MSKWHYVCKEDVYFKDDNDRRNGKYLVYYIDTFDYLVNDTNWVAANDAFDERDYLLDHMDHMLESNSGEFVFIPCADLAFKFENYDAAMQSDYSLYDEFASN